MTVEVYFRMLTLELAGESYTKSEFRREVEREVERSSGAIEYKFNNVSAVLDELGAVWIAGYKPLRNVQDRLRTVVRERFEEDNELRAFMLQAVAAGDVAPSKLGVEVDPPNVEWPTPQGARDGVLGINFAAIESSNRALGRAGEVSVVAAEKERLTSAGREDLAAEVRHVSVTEGDGLGYDVQSFQGRTDEPVYIEVKTTRYGKEVPFYISGNEVEASIEFGPTYRLWRLYRFGRPDTGYYRLPGPLTQHARLRPDTYRGLPSVGSK
ncbi:DUF3883 domain-containing protein [Nocardioides sp. AE5]|uniref:DUF3883 domain-containing protein n=1 Tax=Nocardioides sp. AE5 TaxID=2962573 RepID=UPI002881943D|nr:DUF3883 domain-containing protein [Nocardioides sp. AE5]MDT0202400.1 DUF3883 domain-containing protein [Nocardioides sp. AE5]